MDGFKRFLFSTAVALGLMLGITAPSHAACVHSAGPAAGTTTWSDTVAVDGINATCFEVAAPAGSDLSFFVDDSSTASTLLYLVFGPGLSYFSTAGVPALTEFRLDYANVLGGLYNGVLFFQGRPGTHVDFGATIGRVPEPATLALMIAGLAAIGLTMRRRRLVPLRT